MALPVNIPDLLSGNVVEWDRLEFKEGWNPEEAIQAVCAFANDFHNWGGGYLVIGIAEKDGVPQLPPKGLSQSEADKAQRKLLELGHQLQPAYHPICEPVEYQGKLVLVVWVPGGEMRPYKAPVNLAKGNKEWAYYIRINANTVRAKGHQEQELLGLANKIPFDDRQNMVAKVTDFDPVLIEQFLAEVQSTLVDDMSYRDLATVGRKMQVVRGPEEAPRPLNVGLLFFTMNPAAWFPQTQIDVVHLPDGAGGDRIIERPFRGPLPSMLRWALEYLKSRVVARYTEKQPGQAEAPHYYNVPYGAIEEALVNAVYHRSYEEREPIEVRITPEELTILSFPGPDRSVDMEQLRQGKAVARRYRNRRIGEFLKELQLSEGRSTGIPKILQAMKDNGSGPPVFETDPDRTSFLVRLPVRPAPESDETLHDTPHDNPLVSKDQEGATQHDTPHDTPHDPQVKKLLEILDAPMSRPEAMEALGLKDRMHFARYYLEPAMTAGLVAMTLPDTPRSKNQQYRLTAAGKAFKQSN
jgi:ATP-dependent DNA helicase RecG